MIHGPNPGGKTMWSRSSDEIMIIQNKIKLDSNYVGAAPANDTAAEAAWPTESDSSDPSSVRNTSFKMGGAPGPSKSSDGSQGNQPPQPMQMSFNQPGTQASGGAPSLSDAMASAGYGQAPPSFFGQAPAQLNSFAQQPPTVPAQPNYPGASAETYVAEPDAGAYPPAAEMPPGLPAGYESGGFEPAAYTPPVQVQAHFAQAHPFESAQTPITPAQAPYPPAQAPFAEAQTPITPAQAPYLPAQAPLAPAQTPFAPAQTPFAPAQTPFAPAQIPLAPAQTPNPAAAAPPLNPAPANYGSAAYAPSDAVPPESGASVPFATAGVSPQLAAQASESNASISEYPASSPEQSTARIPLPPPVQFDNELFTEVLLHLTDDQTGLVTYSAFIFFVFREFARFQKLQSPLAIAVFEVALHSGGSIIALPPNAVPAVASCIRGICGPLDIVTHLGGGEFAALLPSASGADAANFSAALHGTLMQSQINIGEQACSLLVAIGAGSIPETCNEPGVLFAAAGQAKEMSKSSNSYFMLFPTGN
jgi:hypothetical protein